METVAKFSDDPVLLKLHRKYGKDEALKYLFEEISSLRFQLGEMASENAELSDLLSKLPEPNDSKTAKEWKKDDYVKELKLLITRAMEKKREAERDSIKWRDRYFSLLAGSADLNRSEPTITE